MLIRSALPSDALALARVHVRAWQAAYRNLRPASYLDGLRPEDRALRYDFSATEPGKQKTIVSIGEHDIAGFATFAEAQDADVCACGEIGALYVDPDCWRQGTG